MTHEDLEKIKAAFIPAFEEMNGDIKKAAEKANISQFTARLCLRTPWGRELFDRVVNNAEGLGHLAMLALHKKLVIGQDMKAIEKAFELTDYAINKTEKVETLEDIKEQIKAAKKRRDDLKKARNFGA